MKQLKDIVMMPGWKPSVTKESGGLRSVSEGQATLHPAGYPICTNHGAMNAVNPEATIWRCFALGCHAGAYREELGGV